MNPIGDANMLGVTAHIRWWARLVIWAYRWALNLRILRPTLREMDQFIDWLFETGGVRLEGPNGQSYGRRAKGNHRDR